ncbi:hypothetical protein TNCV_2254491 [Trichonephila clavipes]|nr:hypothetical protein TNCV_2254491 [Trichonephila clavipes]
MRSVANNPRVALQRGVNTTLTHSLTNNDPEVGDRVTALHYQIHTQIARAWLLCAEPPSTDSVGYSLSPVHWSRLSPSILAWPQSEQASLAARSSQWRYTFKKSSPVLKNSFSSKTPTSFSRKGVYSDLFFRKSQQTEERNRRYLTTGSNFSSQTSNAYKALLLIDSTFWRDSSSKVDTDDSHLVRDQDCMADGVGASNQELQFGFGLPSLVWSRIVIQQHNGRSEMPSPLFKNPSA